MYLGKLKKNWRLDHEVVTIANQCIATVVCLFV